MFSTSSDPQSAGPRARSLYERVQRLGVPFGLERSFRVSRKIVRPHRFLLSLSKGSLGAAPLRTLVTLARELGMPEALLHQAARAFDPAEFIHLGYEDDGAACMYKLYLETHVPPDRPNIADAVLLHRAFKWDPADPLRHALTEYTWLPELAVPTMRDRMVRLYGETDPPGSPELALAVLHLAAERTTHGGIRYLEVTENGNPRRSFDLNIYDARLSLADLSEWLERIGQYYEIPDDSFGPLLDAFGARAVGHLAGGIHRGGEDFLTVYYGVEER